MTKFNLSERREEIGNWLIDFKNNNCSFEEVLRVIEKQDKEFIKKLKEEFEKSKWIDDLTKRHFKAIIDTLAGEELI